MDLVNALGPVQSCVEAKILAQEDLSRLEENVENFKNKLFSSEKPPMTSKTHCLLYHVYPFATRFCFWGAAAEHGIEQIHKMLNAHRRMTVSNKNRITTAGDQKLPVQDEFFHESSLIFTWLYLHLG
jgi:hypothetical protein